jgi:hypothetical protein
MKTLISRRQPKDLPPSLYWLLGVGSTMTLIVGFGMNEFLAVGLTLVGGSLLILLIVEIEYQIRRYRDLSCRERNSQ